MNAFWLRIIAFGLLILLVLAPFAGFAPLFLIILIAGICWFLGSVFQILVSVKPSIQRKHQKTRNIAILGHMRYITSMRNAIFKTHA